MGTGIQTETRTYDTTTNSLKELGEWLEELKVTDGAMESTGIYWKPGLYVLREYPLNLMAREGVKKILTAQKQGKNFGRKLGVIWVRELVKGRSINKQNNIHRRKKQRIKG